MSIYIYDDTKMAVGLTTFSQYLIEAIDQNGIQRTDEQILQVNDKYYRVNFDENSKATNVDIVSKPVENEPHLFLTSNRKVNCRELLKELNDRPILMLHDKVLSSYYSKQKLSKTYDALCFSGGGAKGMFWSNDTGHFNKRQLTVKY